MSDDYENEIEQLQPYRQAAVQYANRYAERPNSAYGELDPDCTDFASQVLEAGGFNPDGDWKPFKGHTAPWHDPSGWNPFGDDFRWGEGAGRAWSYAPALLEYIKDGMGAKAYGPKGRALPPISLNPTTGNPDPLALTKAGLKPGDLVFYDWGHTKDGKPEGVEHTAVYVGQRKIQRDGKEVLSDVVDYHSNDKKWQFWALPADDSRLTVTYRPVHITYPGDPDGPSPSGSHERFLASSSPAGPLPAQRNGAITGAMNPVTRPLPRFADGGEVEGRGEDFDDGPVALGRSGSWMPFTQWSSIAKIAGSALGQQVMPQVFAEGGAVDEHGPDGGDSGFLSTAQSGTVGNFLQWHDWFDIHDKTSEQVKRFGGQEALEALAGAVAGPSVAAGAAAVTTLTNSVGNMLRQFSGSGQSKSGGPPKAKPLPLSMPTNDGGSGATVDRTMTINVFGPQGPLRDPMADRLRQQAATYMSHLR